MRTIRTAVLALVLVITCSALYAHATDSVIVKTKEGGFLLDFKPMKTHGNWSYVPINLSGRPDMHERYILTILETLESLYSYEVISFQIEKQQSAHMVSPHTFGIWVHHRPK